MAPDPTVEPPSPVAAIDIGTNSVHLLVALVRPLGASFGLEPLAREKQMVRLGEGGGDMKKLSVAAMDRALGALDHFRRVAAASDAAVRAVATSAVREADNRQEFIDRARRESGIEVEVISGREEARLIHLGVLSSVPVFDRRHLVIDIGGGSTELVCAEGAETLACSSLKLGAIRLTSQFFSESGLDGDLLDRARRHVRARLEPFVRSAGPLGHQVAVASSGTAGALVTMAEAARSGEVPRSAANLTMSRSELDQLVERLAEAQRRGRSPRLPGLEPRRADIILGGALVLEGVMRALDIDEVVHSDAALREGLVLDTVARSQERSLAHLSGLRRRSVWHLLTSCDEDPTHARHTASLALRLFDETRALHRGSADDRELLEAAALLANVGLVISHDRHHKHSAYVIRNSDRLSGFTRHEIELIAVLARYHRKSAPKPKHGEFAALSAPDQQRIRYLAGLLRLAIALDRGHAGAVADVSVRIDADRLVVDLVPARVGSDLTLELDTAAERSALAAQTLGRSIVLGSSAGNKPETEPG